MILKVSKSRYHRLAAGSVPAEVYDRERRCLVKGGHAEPPPSDIASMERAKAKRERKAAKVARVNPVCFGA